ncbi:hypothetical protein SELMODRAFT_111225 [Selaginella moellendorffii]|uniref:Mitochondrial import inner membrane translocase subunit TIM50 n=1 Tax=Selaginella moellendorffii TaxID=88036 RepID=D8S8Q6_SELML|nr:hypothetical protein SELMODRAFT_111225 [Selaginella moellendorffii]
MYSTATSGSKQANVGFGHGQHPHPCPTGATLRLFSGKVVPLERLAKRPGVDEFLRDMAKLYKIVVFTAAMQYYADKILDKLDPDELITHRLYRCVL